jgi:hypothetical protein
MQRHREVRWCLRSIDDNVIRRGYEFPAITEVPSFYLSVAPAW